MLQDAACLISLLRQRQRAFKSLAAEVSAGQEACIALDVEDLQLHDQEKLRLCAEVRCLNQEIAAFRHSPVYEEAVGSPAKGSQRSGMAVDVEILQCIRKILQDSDAARAEVARRNNIYEAFLCRARSNINVMINVVSHCLGVYPPWVSPAAAGSPWERSY
ncbi:MAG: hypothetical protein ACRD3O_23150 [Terriglobia bacterium]